MDNTTKKEINSKDLEGFLDYISGVSANMLDLNKDTIYKESQKPDNLAIIKTFVTDQNIKLLCISKIDNSVPLEGAEENQVSKPDEIVFESELKYKGIKSYTVTFIKKDNNALNISEADNKVLSNQLQVLNFNSEANDMNIFLFLQNYIQGAFSPLFTSYQSTITGNVINILIYDIFIIKFIYFLGWRTIKLRHKSKCNEHNPEQNY